MIHFSNHEHKLRFSEGLYLREIPLWSVSNMEYLLFYRQGLLNNEMSNVPGGFSNRYNTSLKYACNLKMNFLIFEEKESKMI